jgi:hypothetical protein
MSEFDFQFEELPVVVDLGFEAGLVDGTATIKFEASGEWWVDGITLDGSRRRSENERQAEKADTGLTAKLYEIKPVKVDRASYSWLYAAITDQLENGRFKDSVEDEVRKEMAAHRADAADQRREQLRDDAAENSTRNRA